MEVSPKRPPTPHWPDVLLGTFGVVSGFVRGKASNVCQGNLFLEGDGSVNDGDGYGVEVLCDGTNGVTNGGTHDETIDVMHDETIDETIDGMNGVMTDGAQLDELLDELPDEENTMAAATVCPSHQGRCIPTHPHRVLHRLTNRNRRHWTVLSVQNGWTYYRTPHQTPYSALHPEPYQALHPKKHPKKHPNDSNEKATVQPLYPNEPKPSPSSVKLRIVSV